MNIVSDPTVGLAHATATVAVAHVTATRGIAHKASSIGINITFDANTILAVATVVLALSTIALVYMTWSNAKKTQRLVDETREAREMGSMPVIRCELVQLHREEGTSHKLDVVNVGNSPAFHTQIVLETINKDVASRVFPRTELELGTLGQEEEQVGLDHPEYVEERPNESRVSIRATYQNIYKQWVVTRMEAVQAPTLVGGGQWYWKSCNEEVVVVGKGQRPES